jgi:DNA-directed RNA polymerase I, II, and III subunit RPABC2
MSDSEGYSSSSDSDSDDDVVKTHQIRGGAKKNAVPIVNKMAYDDDEDDEEDEDDEVVGSDEEDADYNKKALDLDKKKINKMVGIQSDDEDEEEEDEDDDDYEEDLDDEDKPAAAKKAKKNVKIAVQNLPPSLFGEDGDGEDQEEEDDDDENYLQKFEIDVNRNYINEFHPECVSHNYDEIAKMSNVIRDDNGIIVDPFHKTIPFLTKYERARVLGQRAKQIETGSKPLVKIPDNIIDGYLIAEMELEQKKIPFIIRRPLPNGASEYWRLNDLELIAF